MILVNGDTYSHVCIGVVEEIGQQFLNKYDKHLLLINKHLIDNFFQYYIDEQVYSE